MGRNIDGIRIATTLLILLTIQTSLVRGQGDAAKMAQAVAQLDAPEPNSRYRAIVDLAAMGPQASGNLPKIQDMLRNDVQFGASRLVDLEAQDTVGNEDRERANRIVGLLVPLSNLGPPVLPLLSAIAKVGISGLDEKAIADFETLKIKPFMSGIGVTDGHELETHVRRSACVAIGRIRDERGALVLVDVLEALAQWKHRSRPPIVAGGNILRDDYIPYSGLQGKSAKTCIESLGSIGSDNPEVVATLRAHAKWFPEEADTSLRKIAASPLPRQPVIRFWTDSTGQFKVEAEYVKVEQGKVHLRRTNDDQVILVPLVKLSTNDREYVRQRNRR